MTRTIIVVVFCLAAACSAPGGPKNDTAKVETEINETTTDLVEVVSLTDSIGDVAEVVEDAVVPLDTPDETIDLFEMLPEQLDGIMDSVDIVAPSDIIDVVVNPVSQN
jgi:hypothetical protein